MKVIGILEDDPFIAEKLEQIVEEAGHSVGLNTSLPSEFISFARSKKPDLLMMDVNLGQDMDGIETAQEIRSQQNTPIVFITSYFDDLTLARIRVIEPEGFVLKPFREIDVKININLVLHQTSKTEQTNSDSEQNPLFIKKGGEMIKVEPSSILYLKGEDNYTEIYFADGSKHMVSSTLKLMQEQFGVYGFMRIHKSYVINLDRLDTVSGSIVALGKETIPIGKVYKKNLLDALNIV